MFKKVSKTWRIIIGIALVLFCVVALADWIYSGHYMSFFATIVVFIVYSQKMNPRLFAKFRPLILLLVALCNLVFLCYSFVKDENGLDILEVAIIIVSVLFAALVGYDYYKRRKANL